MVQTVENWTECISYLLFPDDRGVRYDLRQAPQVMLIISFLSESPTTVMSSYVEKEEDDGAGLMAKLRLCCSCWSIDDEEGRAVVGWPIIVVRVCLCVCVCSGLLL
jgi:hypothetical protein